MFETLENFNWDVHQNDPNNWVQIPEFGVIPLDVEFEGFAFPILGPQISGIEWRVPVWETVKIVRSIAQNRFGTLANLRNVVQSLQESALLLDPAFDAFTPDQTLAFFYDIFFFNVERAVTQSGKTLADETRRSVYLARAMESSVGLLAGRPLSQETFSSARTELARTGADARHGPTREARDWVRAEWNAHRAGFDGNKSEFARVYSKRLLNERSIKVKEKQIREVWLQDTPPAGKRAGLPADRE